MSFGHIDPHFQTRVSNLLWTPLLPGGGGGHSNGKRGYQAHPGTHKKHPNHVFSGMKINPKYAFLHAFFLICLSCPFQTWPSYAHPFLKFCTKTTIIRLREFLDKPDTPLDIRGPPRDLLLLNDPFFIFHILLSPNDVFKMLSHLMTLIKK